MDDRTVGQFEKDVLTSLLGSYFSGKSDKEIIEIASDPQWDFFIRDGYEQYLSKEKQHPGREKNWGSSVSAAEYNIYMWF